MDSISKALFLLLFGTLVAFVIGAVFAAENPVRWSMEVNEFNSVAEQEIPLREYHVNYRHLTTEIGAWKEEVSFVATPIVPQAGIVLLFIIGQVLGWAFLLTSATYVKNFFAYVVYFAFALSIFLSSAFESVAPDGYWIFNLALAILLFGPAYLLQQSIIRLKFALRFLIFLVVTALPFLLQYTFASWQGLHNSTVGMYPILALVLIVYIFFVSTDLSNLMFYLATNAKNRKYRVKFPVIFGVFMILVAIEFLMLQKELGWNLIRDEELPFRPIYLLAIASVIMVGTKQNLYPILKNRINNRAMSMGLAGLSLVAMSAAFFHFALGEFLFVFMVERLIAIFFFLSTVFHFFYIFYNFGTLIAARVNFYYLSMMPKRLMYFFVVVATALVGFALEASDNGKTRKLFSATLYNRLADQEFLAGNNMEAITLYSTSSGVAKGTVKGNYNLGMLALVLDNTTKAREHFDLATRFHDFPAAALNHANLELDQISPFQAKYILNKNYAATEDPHVANNLALMYMQENKPDTAIILLKKALEQDPANTALYANLGRVYMEYEKPEWATKFYTAGLQFDNPSSGLITNSLFHNLHADAGIDVPDSLINLPQVQAQRSTLFNFALDRYKDRNFDAAKEIVDTLLARAETPDAALLDGMLLFEQGNIQAALSRMLYLKAASLEYRKYIDHYLAVSFFAQGVPEMAAFYFDQSVEAGRFDDRIYAAVMQSEIGNQELAFQKLNDVRYRDSTQFDKVTKEIAMLQLSYGEYFMASIGFDLGTMTPDDWALTGRYAGMVGNLGPALEAFRRYIALDSNSVVPYLEMGKISLALGDTLALENIAPGLKIDPDHVGLRTLKARALLKAGKNAPAMDLARKLKAEAPANVEVGILEAEVYLHNKDTASAIKTFEALHKAHPLHKAVILQLSSLYRATRMDFEGQNMIHDALDINDRNVDYWVEMAYFERLLGREEVSASAANQAILRESDPLKQDIIKEEFARQFAYRDSILNE